MNCEVTYRELAAFSAGDLDATRQVRIREHLLNCGRCLSRLASLNKADAVLAGRPASRTSEGAISAERLRPSKETRGSHAPKLSTLDEVAGLLRVTPEELGQVVIVRAAIAKLPDRQREALALHAFEAMDYGEIAEVLAVPVDTAQALVHRARANLARSLESLCQETNRELCRDV